MPDLDLLREIGQQVRQPAFEALVDTRRRRTRHARTAVVAGTALTALVLAGTLIVAGRSTTSDPAPSGPTPTGSATPSTAPPAGQRTITADIGTGDGPSVSVLATVTNAQPEHRGASELSATVPDSRDEVATYCRAAPDLYYFLDLGDGGGEYGRCSPDAPTTLAPRQDTGDLVVADPAGSPQTVRMWIGRPTTAFLRCQQDGSGDCPLSDVPPAADPGVEFGFEVYAHPSTLAFDLLADAGNGEPYPLQSLSTLDGTGWLVDRAVVAAPGADRLDLELSGSGRERLVDVYSGPGRHLEQCRTQHEDELPDRVSTDHLVYEAAFEEVCGVDLRLVVDGATVDPERDPHARGHFRELGALLAPGADHRVAVEVVRGDPRDLQYAVVVRVRTPNP